jgi:hypothetical protein
MQVEIVKGEAIIAKSVTKELAIEGAFAAACQNSTMIGFDLILILRMLLVAHHA